MNTLNSQEPNSWEICNYKKVTYYNFKLKEKLTDMRTKRNYI